LLRIDPHFHNLTPNIAASKHVFDMLVTALEVVGEKRRQGTPYAFDLIPRQNTLENEIAAAIKFLAPGFERSSI
jgi:hypothetical protein